jgi:hypothetical protein
MAGFGGGSTYIALLSVSGLPLAVVPIVALVCNLIVSSQGSYLLVKKGHAQVSMLLPLLAGSIPCAYLGGAWRLPESAFLGILATALTVAGVAMLAQKLSSKEARPDEHAPSTASLFGVGVGLGLVAGVTGIGGGIYLAPVMHLLRWANARRIAACTSLFIALNSLAGLIGQLTKGASVLSVVPSWMLIGCPFAVLIGGRIGSHFLTEKLPLEKVRFLTAGVILLVALRLWIKLIA